MPRQMSPEQLAEAREIFDHFDDNNNDRMEASEFYRLLNALAGGFSAEQAEAGFHALDLDGNGTIEFNEFVAWWKER